eukprot:SAG11_NODE_3430_length_2451_cov_1.846939_1_plen_176_part_00
MGRAYQPEISSPPALLNERLGLWADWCTVCKFSRDWASRRKSAHPAAPRLILCRLARASQASGVGLEGRYRAAQPDNRPSRQPLREPGIAFARAHLPVPRQGLLQLLRRGLRPTPNFHRPPFRSSAGHRRGSHRTHKAAQARAHHRESPSLHALLNGPLMSQSSFEFMKGSKTSV